MSTQLSISTIVMLFGAFLLVAYAVSAFVSKGKENNKEEFLVANREISLLPAGSSIAASWIWAPALFVSAQKAYQEGFVGFFWFLVPNILCLILFSHFAVKIRERLPLGFTISGYMKENHSTRVQKVYWLTTIGLTICAFAVQLIAGGTLISKLTGLSYFWSTVLITAVPMTYSMVFGVRASIITDYLKIAVLIGFGLVLVPFAISQTGGIDTLVAGFTGKTGEYTSLISGKGIDVFLTFGIPVSIGLISGPFGDQSFWQRAYATDKKEVKKAFLLSAFLFALVPIMMACLGFIAAGLQLPVKNPGMVNFELIVSVLPSWCLIAFVIMVISGISSIIDSKLCSVASIAGHDIAEAIGKDSMTVSKVSMVILGVAAIAIANIRELTLLHLFLFYGTLRASTLLPTVMTLGSLKKVSEKGVFFGILTSIIIGLPMFSVGSIMNINWMKLTGSILTILLSGVIAYVFTLYENSKKPVVCEA